MILFAFQFAILLLIALSFLLVIAVPVAAASPNGWEENKALIFLCAAGWIFLVILIGILNSFVI